jgi:hypothetical protein
MLVIKESRECVLCDCHHLGTTHLSPFALQQQ